jgi:type I restriction enzyme, S subunit
MSFTASLDDIIAENRNGLLSQTAGAARIPLGKVAKILNGAPFASSEFVKTGGTPLIRIRDVLRGASETGYTGNYDPAYLVNRDEILVGMDGDFHCAAWQSEPSLLNQRVCKITPDPEKLHPKFLLHILPGYLDAINANTPSITVKHLSSRTLGDVPLPLPPLPTQHRIVAEIEEKLSRLDAAQSALLRAQANLKRYRDLTVLEAVTGGRESLNKAWNPDDSPALPKGWRWTPMATIASLTGGLAKSANRITVAPRRLVPYLRVANVQRGYLDLKEIKEIEATEAEIKDLRLEQDDVLFNEGGDRDKLGRGWLWDNQIPEAIHQNHVFRARADLKQVLPLFLSYCGNSYGAAWFWHHGKQTTNLASLSLKVLRAFPISLPPLKVQQQIVTELERRLSVIDRTEQTLRTQLERAKRLRQSILQQAFASPTALPS